ALYDRARDGGGTELNVALMNAGIFLLSELIQSPDGTFHGAPQLSSGQTGYHPAEQMYEARDGWIAVAARSENAARDFARVLGLDALAERPRKAWNESDAAEIAAAIHTRPLQDLMAEFA